MVISDFAIKRPMITVVTMVALVVFGLFALLRLQTDEFPDIEQPVVLVGVPYPGASPEGVEREILKPVEDAIKGISGVDQILGTASDGYAQIIVIFLFEKDVSHFVLFLLEIFRFNFFWEILLRTLLATLFTLLLSIITIYLIKPSKR